MKDLKDRSNKPGSTPADNVSSDENMVKTRYNFTVECTETADGKKRSCHMADFNVNRSNEGSGPVDYPTSTTRAETDAVTLKDESTSAPATPDNDCEFCDLVESVTRDFPKSPDAKQNSAVKPDKGDAPQNAKTSDQKWEVPSKLASVGRSGRFPRTRDLDQNGGK